MHGFRTPDGTARTLPADGVLAGTALADKLGVRIGDDMTVIPAGGSARKIRLVGLVDEPLGTALYATNATARSITNTGPDGYLVRFDNDVDRDRVRAAATALPGVVAYTDTHAVENQIDSYLVIFWVFAGAMLVLGALLAFTVIYVTMTVNLAERTGELATLRAAGAPIRRLTAAVAIENLAATLLAVPIGLAAGVGPGMAVPAFVQQRPVQPPPIRRPRGTDPRDRRRHGGRRYLAATRSPADQTHRRRQSCQGAFAIDITRAHKEASRVMAAAKLVVRLLEALVRDGVNSSRRLFVVLMKESRWLSSRSRFTSPLAYWLSAAALDAVAPHRVDRLSGNQPRVGLFGLAGGIGFIARHGGWAGRSPAATSRRGVAVAHPRPRWVNAAGFALAVCGLAATLYAQLDMGESWRVGVDTSETTTLVRTGTFRLIRNPIFAAMLVFMLGETLLAPNPVAIAVFAIFFAAVEVSVRTVEEPYLLRYTATTTGITRPASAGSYRESVSPADSNPTAARGCPPCAVGSVGGSTTL